MSKKQTTVSQNKLLWVAIIILLVVNVFSIVYTMVVDMTVQNHVRATFELEQKVHYQQQVRDHCYDNSIVPCTKDAIWQWEANHPTQEKFVFKTESQIVDAFYTPKF